ncbi:MAG TPA: hypothetical protein VH475_05330 [Tepidisphaeraceae bacterium]|jgi:hypothetical protein
MFLASGGFMLAVCGILLTLNAAASVADHWLIIILVGVALIVLGFSRLHDRSPNLILTDASLLCTIGNRIEIRWSDLADAQTATHRDEITYLILRLIDPAAEPQPPTLWNRPAFDRPPEAADEDIILPISGLNASPELILSQVRSRIATAQRKTA